jgi:DNA-binding CsgD family transcriptional regulator/tetratricopeptide (TPR) repeat protein
MSSAANVLESPARWRADPPSPSVEILGRRAVCETLDQVVEAVRKGESRGLVIRGEAGIGKTALLEYLRERASASGCGVAQVAGVQSEMELPFAAVHQLCAPMLDRLPRLPEPQREALATAFAIQAGPPPNRFLVGLAVLGLLAESAEEQPLVCLIDDAQWLDRASWQALAFAARRLAAESVAMIFAVRSPGDDPDLTGLPDLLVRGLSESDAEALLSSVIPVPLDGNVRNRIVAEAHGNPLAILELPHALSPAELASGLLLPTGGRLISEIENSFGRRVTQLPPETQRLLLIAAAEPRGDPVLVWRAAEQLGVGIEAAAPATNEGLCALGASLRFRHPLVRSAVYRAASVEARRTVHRALADATDPEIAPDRYLWHRALAAAGCDEELAAELERLASRAQERGSWAQAAAFLQQASAMTPDPLLRAKRALRAARAECLTADFDAALGLLVSAQAGPLDELGRRHVDLLRAEIAFAVNRGSDAAPLLLSAAKRLEPLDVTLARDTYLEAFSAAMFAGRLSTGVGVREVAEAASAAPRPPQRPPRPADLLLDALAVRFADGYTAGTTPMRRVVDAFRTKSSPEHMGVPVLWIACIAASDLLDDEAWDALSARHLQSAREGGVLSELPLALNSRIYVHLFAGELAPAASLVEEIAAVTEATGSRLAPFGALGLLAWQGRQAEANDLMETTTAAAVSRGEGIGVAVTQWASALLDNGLGRYEDALVAAQQAAEHSEEMTVPTWALVESIEASTRSGRPEVGIDALRQLVVTTQASGTDWALGLEARSRALLTRGEDAERRYLEAIERLERTRVRAELARAHLVYGEWLRRERRRLDAREQLGTAHEMLLAMGIDGFAERAARELRATGATARKRRVELSGNLTPQEAQIARLASDGLSNPEIAGRLFLSPRTIEYHLHKVFTKLQINSRNQLAVVLVS